MPESNFITKVRALFQGKNPPFLFIGSGFSRRHLGLDDFKGLLESTCLENMKPFEYYYSTASEDLPKVALTIALDFQNEVWSDKKLSYFIEKNKKLFRSNTDAYKFYVSDIIKQKQETAKNEGYKLGNEIEKLKSASVDGIITTNYDTFLEDIFSDFKTFIGQGELIQNNPQFIGEIYKIHGSVNDPHNIVITSEDYKEFEDRNKYIVSKLISSFIERPIVFIGYSISDKHIQNIIKDVCLCCRDNIEKIKGNLIFLERAKSDSKTCTESILTYESTSVPYWCIKTDDFGEVYTLIKSERKIPVNLFRMFKEQLYQLTLTGKPTKNIQLIDADKIEKNSDIEFLVGFGVSKFSEKGYDCIERKEILEDVLLNNKNYNANLIIERTMKLLLRDSVFVPIYKYLKLIGINSNQDIQDKNLYELFEKCIKIKYLSNYSNRHTGHKINKYSSNNQKHIDDFKSIGKKNITGIIEHSKEKQNKYYALNIIPMLGRSIEEKDKKLLLDYLIEVHNSLQSEIDTASIKVALTNFGKVVCYYDRITYGWD